MWLGSRRFRNALGPMKLQWVKVTGRVERTTRNPRSLLNAWEG